jgi:hypothetical protein
MAKVKIFERTEKVQGFNFQEGFAAFLNDSGEIVAATSGYETDNGNGGYWGLYVYRPDSSGDWVGEWENNEEAYELLGAIEKWQEKKELEKALKFAEGKKLKISETPLRFTAKVPGRKCHDGGEYGFYSRYCPIPEHPGIYKVFTETTCNFDSCGTGYQGIRALTVSEYRKLKRESDKVEAAGSLY